VLGEQPCLLSERKIVINGYLVTVLLAALPTFFAFAAPRRTALLARASFWLGIAINELPWYLIVWLAVATILAWNDGALMTVGGLVALALAVLTVAGLVMILARGLAAPRQLAHAFGHAGVTEMASAVLGARSAGQTVLSILAPFARGVRGVRRVKNISYGQHGRRNRLDVYRSTAQQPGPVLVYFHGGGYFSGRKNKEARRLLYRLARQGWVCISANYRLRPEAGFEEHLADLGKVLAWVRNHGAGYGGDPARIVLAGSSAGAHMASIAALSPELPQLREGPTSPVTGIAGVVCLYGYYGNYYGGGPLTSPMGHVHPDAPPFLIVHGDHDTYVPVSAARKFAETLRAASRSIVVYAELQGAQHAFDLFRSPRFESVVDAVEAFTEACRGDEAAIEGGTRRL
jgi:acetyl esterase/lipase